MVQKRGRSSTSAGATTPATTTKIQRVTAEPSIGPSVSLPSMIISILWFYGHDLLLKLGLEEILSSKLRPLAPYFMNNIVNIVQGTKHCAVLLTDGTIWSLGCNADGALGRRTGAIGDSGMDPAIPTAVTLPAGATKAVQIVGTESGCFVLTTSGAIYGWGTFKHEDQILGFSPTVFKQPLPTCVYKPSKTQSPVVKLRSGNNHVIGVLKSGGVISWGAGFDGQLGRIGMRHSPRKAPRRGSMLSPSKIGGYKQIKFVDAYCGETGTFLKEEHGQFYAFGMNQHGQLAIEHVDGAPHPATLTKEEQVKTRLTCLQPTLVTSFQALDIYEVAMGSHHALGLNGNGDVYSWGAPQHGQLGREDVIPFIEANSPHPVPRLVEGFEEQITAIGAGKGISGCLDEYGDMYTWGKNTENIYGDSNMKDILLPEGIPADLARKDGSIYQLSIQGDSFAFIHACGRSLAAIRNIISVEDARY